MPKTIVDTLVQFIDGRKKAFTSCIQILQSLQSSFQPIEWLQFQALRLNEYQYKLYLNRYEAITLKQHRNDLHAELKSRLQYLQELRDRLLTQILSVKSDQFTEELLINNKQLAYLKNLLQILKSIPMELEKLTKIVKNERVKLQNSRLMSIDEVRRILDDLKDKIKEQIKRKRDQSKELYQFKN